MNVDKVLIMMKKIIFILLPLPKDNPDLKAPILISSCNDDYKDLKIKKVNTMLKYKICLDWEFVHQKKN